MKTYWFVAGEQAIRSESISLLDAWLKIEVRSKREPIAAEFRTMPIEAYDDSGNKLAVRPWDKWHEAVLRDTYGSNWAEHIEHAAALAR